MATFRIWSAFRSDSWTLVDFMSAAYLAAHSIHYELKMELFRPECIISSLVTVSQRGRTLTSWLGGVTDAGLQPKSHEFDSRSGHYHVVTTRMAVDR